MGKVCDVAIIGAGPYGLSVAAHLAHSGLSFRIFGKAMDTWRHHVPKDMLLKSEGMASSLSSPLAGSRLEDYCANHGLPYSDHALPVQLNHFNDYATWFQKTFVPSLDERMVVNLTRDDDLFTLTLQDGERLQARRVVVAAGITWFANMPKELKGLPAWAASHSYQHYDVSALKGKEVTVLGAGASAIDLAATLDDAGAFVRILARRDVIPYHSSPSDTDDAWYNQIRKPQTGIGPGWRSFMCVNAPLLFHKLPAAMRLRAVRTHLGPAPGWFMRERIEGKVKSVLNHDFTRIEAKDGHVVIDAKDRTTGETSVITCDHVIAATGYRVNLERLPFLQPSLRASVDQLENTPILSDQFETSVDGLYFTGTAAANSFGPLLRFMVGAEFAAPRLAAELKRSFARNGVKRAVA